ncbi:P-loop containing nucleoside triphosphate hydrolase protein [Rhizoclosmatium globosum]|uniref:p-loop containing nucleoside triphosphate hydrolase protein n=1 Tax=Rhizoclosmatium globosum TaxID=329046 RepID=A0A1Y2CVL5_9FUNG|nr:P-loop containing nucleoside triphosphate hydrolase protein [Rhizoclosmatium globosum]|eukprot:ORY50385.1 P-loop containing nucleoside triphosphate hydrolase protein [Rhizoclosmatium globosum]
MPRLRSSTTSATATPPPLPRVTRSSRTPLAETKSPWPQKRKATPAPNKQQQQQPAKKPRRSTSNAPVSDTASSSDSESASESESEYELATVQVEVDADGNEVGPRIEVVIDLKDLASDDDADLLVVPPPPRVRSNAVSSSPPPTKKEVSVVTRLSALSDAKAAFKPSSAPGRLVGRESERETISAFLNEQQSGGRSLYVSGVPGTGKSAMIDEIVEDFIQSHKESQTTEYQLVKINCMQFNDSTSIYKRVMSEFNVPEGAFGTLKNEPFRTLERFFGFMDGGDKIGVSRKITMAKNQEKAVVHILVLDEIDQLATKDNSVLYRIFEWPVLPNSTLLLIGIANALDLMQRYLPRLSGMKGGPRLLNFNPYTPAEISSIIKSRLLNLQQATFLKLQSATSSVTSVTVPSASKQLLSATKPPFSSVTKCDSSATAPTQLVSFMHPTAIEVCARKAAGTGDLRKALDLVRMSFEILEVELRRKHSAATISDSKENIASSTSQQDLLDLSAPITTLEEVPKLAIQQVLKAASTVSDLVPPKKCVLSRHNKKPS